MSIKDKFNRETAEDLSNRTEQLGDLLGASVCALIKSQESGIDSLGILKDTPLVLYGLYNRFVEANKDRMGFASRAFLKKMEDEGVIDMMLERLDAFIMKYTTNGSHGGL